MCFPKGFPEFNHRFWSIEARRNSPLEQFVLKTAVAPALPVPNVPRDVDLIRWVVRKRRFQLRKSVEKVALVAIDIRRISTMYADREPQTDYYECGCSLPNDHSSDLTDVSLS